MATISFKGGFRGVIFEKAGIDIKRGKFMAFPPVILEHILFPSQFPTAPFPRHLPPHLPPCSYCTCSKKSQKFETGRGFWDMANRGRRPTFFGFFKKTDRYFLAVFAKREVSRLLRPAFFEKRGSKIAREIIFPLRGEK